MKRLITSFLSILSIAAFAQPTISSSVMGVIGDDMSTTIVNTTGFDPGPAGASVTWDFSAIETSGIASVFTLVDPSATGVAGDFPGANVANDDGSGTYAFFNATTSQYSVIGVYSPTTTIFYSDPEELFIFPINYGDSNSDDLYSEFTSGVDMVRSGSNVVNADGYGTLILPSGSYSDVLRVKIEQDYADEAVGIPYSFEYNFDLYYWFKAGVKGPIFQYYYQDITTGGFPSIVENYLINSDVEVTSIENNPGSVLLSIYPNPADDVLNISMGTKVRLISSEIFDVAGQKVSGSTNLNAGSTASIDVSKLKAGIYIVRLVTSEGNYSRTINIQ